MERRDVLIAVRNHQIREVLHQVFVSRGYTCALASDGEEGLAVFRKTRPLLVITDLIMPVLQEDPDVAVIVVTDIVDMGEVLNTAERVLGHRQLARRAPTGGTAIRLRDPEEGWRTPEQFLDAFEYFNRQYPGDPQFSVGIPIIRAWMNLRSRQTVSQADLDGLLDRFTADADGSQIGDLWGHIVRWGSALGLSVPYWTPWYRPA